MSKVLFKKDNDGIARITLNNPEKQNAFDDEIILDLINISVSYTHLRANET